MAKDYLDEPFFKSLWLALKMLSRDKIFMGVFAFLAAVLIFWNSLLKFRNEIWPIWWQAFLDFWNHSIHWPIKIIFFAAVYILLVLFIAKFLSVCSGGSRKS